MGENEKGKGGRERYQHLVQRLRVHGVTSLLLKAGVSVVGNAKRSYRIEGKVLVSHFWETKK